MFQSCCLHRYIQTKGHFKSDIHVLSVLQLLEKQRVENRFGSYEVHIDHFLRQSYYQFWKSFNPVYLQI